jgi:hypothetical protein
MQLMSIWEILVPTVRNDGTPIRTRFHREWDRRVRRISGGLTVLPPARGQWLSPSKQLFEERMIPVRIACTRKQIETIADMTAAYYRQQAVMFYKISDEVVIKHYGEHLWT